VVLKRLDDVFANLLFGVLDGGYELGNLIWIHIVGYLRRFDQRALLISITAWFVSIRFCHLFFVRSGNLQFSGRNGLDATKTRHQICFDDFKFVIVEIVELRVAGRRWMLV
jgi:hypothetical protein